MTKTDELIEGAIELKALKNILCVVDINEDSTSAVERAVSLAVNNQASLTIISVANPITARLGMPKGGPIASALQSARTACHEQALIRLVNSYRETIPITTKVRCGIRFLEIIRQVLSARHDLVINVPEKVLWLDRLFGSDDMNLLRECPCPVLLVKPQAKNSFRRIMAAVDVSDDYPQTELKSRNLLNQHILEMAASLAISEFAELHVVAAWHATGESAMNGTLATMYTPEKDIVSYVEQEKRRHEANLDGLMRKCASKLGTKTVQYINPSTHLVKGWARKEIPAMAEQLAADVIVMGTVARTGVPGFIMGNTAETILNQINCSVLAIKPPGFKTSVALTD